MSVTLSQNAVSSMIRMNGTSDNPGFCPLLQVLQVKKVNSDRWKVVLSDGDFYVSGMIAQQHNDLIRNGVVSEHAILRINDFIINQMGTGQKVIILLNIESGGTNPGSRIREPKDIRDGGGAAGAGSNGAGAGGGGAQSMYGNVQPSGGGGEGGTAGQYNNPRQGGGYGGGGKAPPQAKSNPYGGGGKGGNPYGQSRSPGSSSSEPIVRTSATGQPLTPISGLNMYSNRWVIRAKVTDKSDVRTWSNARGEGSLFSLTLLDSSGTDVKATFFKEAVEKFYGMVEEGRVYTFSGGRLKVANMQYNKCKSQFEITFDQNSEIHLDTDTGDIQEQYDFVKITELENTEPGAFVDVLAVVKHVGELGEIVSKKTGKEMTKCELIIEDDSGADVKVTVWNDTAKNAQSRFANGPVVAFKRARVSDFGGRSLSAGGFSVEPNIPQATGLKQWWATHGNKPGASRSLSSAAGGRGMDPFDQRKTLSSVKGEHLGFNEKPDWLSFKATITFLKKDKDGGAWYTACANAGEPCKNMYKATMTSDGNYHCDKCQQTHPNCVRRFIFSGTLSDDTSTSWVSVFNEQAEAMFESATADSLYQQCFENDSDMDPYNSVFAKASFTEWIFKCKVKNEMVGDESRVKTSVVSVHPIDYVKESRELLRALQL